MKKFLILPIITIIVFQAMGTNAFFDKCPQLVQQYYECQHLTMLPNNSNTTNTFPSWRKYVRDLSKSRNSLNESFYKQQLGKMNLSDALDFIWTIYMSSRNCESESCKCLAFDTFDEARLVEDFFHHGKKFSFFEQTKQVIIEFFKDYHIENRDSVYHKTKNTALESFCRRYFHSYYEIIYTNKEIKMCLNQTNRPVS